MLLVRLSKSSAGKRECKREKGDERGTWVRGTRACGIPSGQKWGDGRGTSGSGGQRTRCKHAHVGRRHGYKRVDAAAGKQFCCPIDGAGKEGGHDGITILCCWWTALPFAPLLLLLRCCCCWLVVALALACLTRWEDRGSCTGTVRSVALTEGYCRYSLQPPSQPLRVPGTGRSLSGFLAAGCGSAGGCGLTERARRESFKKAKVGDID